MVILAIDTCEGYCSAALASDGAALAARCEDIGRGHAERLLPLVDELMAEAGLDFAALGRIAVTTGPGTFTGLRIGLSAARGFALAVGIPCLGFTSLMALAAQTDTDLPVHCLVMGRGGQAFYQPFQGRNSERLPQPLADGEGLDAADIAARVMAAPGIMAGSGQALLSGLVPDHFFTGINHVDPTTLAGLALRTEPALHSPDPTYMRAADAIKARPLLPVA